MAFILNCMRTENMLSEHKDNFMTHLFYHDLFLLYVLNYLKKTRYPGFYNSEY